LKGAKKMQKIARSNESALLDSIIEAALITNNKRENISSFKNELLKIKNLVYFVYNGDLYSLKHLYACSCLWYIILLVCFLLE